IGANGGCEIRRLISQQGAEICRDSKRGEKGKKQEKKKGKKIRKTQKLFSLIQTVSHLRLDQIFSEFFCDF
ncbi:unnamed protein product, partial [Musa textilis]